MKKFFKGLVIILFLAVIGFAVFVFAFDKQIPNQWFFGKAEEATKNLCFESADAFINSDNLGANLNYEKYIYVYNAENSPTKTLSEKYYMQTLKEKKETSVIFCQQKNNYNIAEQKFEDEEKIVYRKTNSYSYSKIVDNVEEKMYGDDWLNEIISVSSKGFALDNQLMFLNKQIVNNPNTTTQKSVNLTFFSSSEDKTTSTELTINFFNKKISKYKITNTKYNSENKITEEEIYEYEYFENVLISIEESN